MVLGTEGMGVDTAFGTAGTGIGSWFGSMRAGNTSTSDTGGCGTTAGNRIGLGIVLHGMIKTFNNA